MEKSIAKEHYNLVQMCAKEDINGLLKALKSPHADIRANAISMLAIYKKRDKRIVPAIRELQNDSSFEVQKKAKEIIFDY